MREISRKLDIPKSTLIYHLKCLEKENFLLSKSDGKYTRYYIPNKIDSKEKKILSVLRKDTTNAIVLYLLSHMYSSEANISRSLKKHPTTIGFHLKKLLDLGIIKPVTVCDGKIIDERDPIAVEHHLVGNEINYAIKEPNYIYQLFTTYKY